MPPAPPRPVGPVASKGLRAGARALDLAAEVLLTAIVLSLFGDHHRPWAGVALIIATITAYEGTTTVWFGGSPAKRILGLHVAELDGVERPRPAAAAKRGAMCGVLTVTIGFAGIVGLGLLAVDQPPGQSHRGAGVLLLLVAFGAAGSWLASVISDPLGRGLADRVAGTMVVPERFTGAVATRDLPGYADAVRRPRMSPWGRIADVDVRGRARMRRINDAPVLAACIGLLALAASLDATPLAIVLGSSAAWIVVFVIHETRLVHRRGVTPGHTLAGLVIVARSTGSTPSTLRSFLRAVVLALTLYVPVLWPLLLVSVALMRFSASGRSLHDLAGGTVVVTDPTLDPETQRQRSMRMRMGRAG